MERLILFRHGKTETRAASGEDFDRALTARGWADTKLVAAALAEEGLIPDRALVSSAVRARQTWESIAPAFPGVVLENRPELYDSSAPTLLNAGQSPLGRTVIIVAHNPGLHILAVALASRSENDVIAARLRQGFPTGSAAVFDFGAPGTGAAIKALGFYRPADFGGGPD